MKKTLYEESGAGPWENLADALDAHHATTAGTSGAIIVKVDDGEAESGIKYILAVPLDMPAAEPEPNELLIAFEELLDRFDTSDVRHLLSKKGEQAECHRLINAARAAIRKHRRGD